MHLSGRSTQIVEPTDDEKDAARAVRTYGPSFSRDNVALGIGAFAMAVLVIAAIVVVTAASGVVRGEYGEQDLVWLVAIGIAAFVVFAGFALAAILDARHHYSHPGERDVFAADGHLFLASFMRDKEKREGDCGIVRIHGVGIAECIGFHNRKNRTA